jgi:hypothetical protein
MLISARLSHLIHNSGVILQNQAQWVIFKGYPGGDLGVANIYTLHSAQERIFLWQALEAALPSSIRWILTGDWNMVLSPRNNSHNISKIAGGSEQMSFARLAGHLGVEDFFPYTRDLLFSWDNKRRVGIRKLKRLDQFYYFPSLTGTPTSHVFQYKILGDCVVSDHFPSG